LAYGFKGYLSLAKMADAKNIFQQRVQELASQKANNAFCFINRDDYNKILLRLSELHQEHRIKKEDSDYKLLKRYGIIEFDYNGAKLQRIVKAGTQLHIVCLEDLFDTLSKHHSEKGHGGRDIMRATLNAKYANISTEQISIFLKLCETCQLKNNTRMKKHIVVKPIISDRFNARAQIDLIDMQTNPDGPYRFILNYQENLSKLCILRALKTKTANEVSEQLIDIFCVFGMPAVIHSDNGREFKNQVLIIL
jgi:hypothetical protein